MWICWINIATRFFTQEESFLCTGMRLTLFAIKFWEIGTLEVTYQVEPDMYCMVLQALKVSYGRHSQQVGVENHSLIDVPPH
jgi:hypothetical protein